MMGIKRDLKVLDFERFSAAAADYEQSLRSTSSVTTHHEEGLRYRFYEGTHPVKNIVIVYHGGGVNLDAGYGILARQLVAESGLSVCLVDMHGHGESKGIKGHLPDPRLLWQNVDMLITALKRSYPQAQYHLLGHSSGAGMLINYFTCHKPAYRITSLTLLAPELGPFAKGVHRKITTVPFARVTQWPFILNALTRGKLFGNYVAVNLNIPGSIDNDVKNLVRKYSVNMANALTPRSPAKQLSTLPLPTLMLVADKDELFEPKAMEEFAKKYGNHYLSFKLLKDSHHLDCLFHSSFQIGEFIKHVVKSIGPLAGGPKPLPKISE
ncbi:alpha/beta fold hydrolase [Erwiniaceae bacterium L1_54_3]|uniref:alpha/beta hydrolase n=1 Tax=Candidatus Pantoea formicae TaxID=2608355 RepID=UPI001F034965|nr:alpha/beta fold hydrolase [Pantoea formicae]MDF7647590.1 alpha/beta fold hydrolase [Erwiniaceae bacterium L1_54_3]